MDEVRKKEVRTLFAAMAGVLTGGAATALWLALR